MMKDISSTSLHLAKQNFKFSSAHFLIFDEHTAEKLHGHNYQVQVDLLTPPDQTGASPQEYFVDFNVFKKIIKERLEIWDEHVLLPAKHPEMKISEKGPSLEVRFRERFYVFPKDEVCLLPITNTSVEQMSQLLAKDLFQEFKKHGILSLRLKIEETRGQAASTSIRS